MTHSILAPSAAHIWGATEGCTGYVTMAPCFPSGPSPESLEGDAAHEMAREMVLAASRGQMLTWQHFEGRHDSKGTEFTEEMFEAVEIYVKNISKTMRECCVFGGDMLGIEQRVDIPRVHAACFGTPDCYLYKTGNTLYIWDFKFGHLYVSHLKNWQLIAYAAGLFDKFGINGHEEQFIKVVFRVVQPRVYGRGGAIREWTCTAAELRGAINTLSNNAAKALSGNGETRSGPHCRDCPARISCKAALEGGLNLYEASGVPVPEEPTPVELGTLLTIVRRAESQLKRLRIAYEARVEALSKNGTIVPGFIAEETLGREVWDDPAQALQLADLCGVNIRGPEIPITPAQARKKGLPEDVTRRFARKPKTGWRIVPDTHNKAERLFKK